MKKYGIREVMTNQDLGHVYGATEKQAYAMAIRDQKDGIFCAHSKHGVKLSELDVDTSSWTMPTEPSILWF